MFAVINSKGELLARAETWEGACVEMETMADFHPLDDKTVVDLTNESFFDHTLEDNMELKEELIRNIIAAEAPGLKNFLEDMITDHQWYLENPNA